MLLVRDCRHVVAARVDWSAVVKLSPLVAASRTYTALTREHRGDRPAPVRSTRSCARRRRRASERLLDEFIVAQVAGVFGTVEDKIDRSARLTTLGLDSLMTLELTNRVERELGIRLPVGSLAERTHDRRARAQRPAAARAGAWRDERGRRRRLEASQPETPLQKRPCARSRPRRRGHLARRSSRHLVVIKQRQRCRRIFCFHPVGGGVGIYAGLVAASARDVPLYRCRVSPVARRHAEYATLDDMVEAYAAAVRGAHGGPYRLLGFSLGGYLAARVAEVLERIGVAG